MTNKFIKKGGDSKADYTDQSGKDWSLKKDEGMNHLKWRAKGSKKGGDPNFDK